VLASLRSLALFTLPFGASVAWGFVIYELSTDPNAPGAGSSALGSLPRADLFVHFGLYWFFSLLLIWTVLPCRIWRPLTLALRTGLPVTLASVFGITMELVQDSIPERSASVDDAVVGILGSISAVIFVFVVRRVLHLGRPRSTS